MFSLPLLTSVALLSNVVHGAFLQTPLGLPSLSLQKATAPRQSIGLADWIELVKIQRRHGSPEVAQAAREEEEREWFTELLAEVFKGGKGGKIPEMFDELVGVAPPAKARKVAASPAPTPSPQSSASVKVKGSDRVDMDSGGMPEEFFAQITFGASGRRTADLVKDHNTGDLWVVDDDCRRTISGPLQTRPQNRRNKATSPSPVESVSEDESLIAIIDKVAGDWDVELVRKTLGFAIASLSLESQSSLCQPLVETSSAHSHVYSFEFEGVASARMLIRQTLAVKSIVQWIASDSEPDGKVDFGGLTAANGTASITSYEAFLDPSLNAFAILPPQDAVDLHQKIAHHSMVERIPEHPGFWSFECDYTWPLSLQLEGLSIAVPPERINLGRVGPRSNRCVSGIIGSDTTGNLVLAHRWGEFDSGSRCKRPFVPLLFLDMGRVWYHNIVSFYPSFVERSNRVPKVDAKGTFKILRALTPSASQGMLGLSYYALRPGHDLDVCQRDCIMIAGAGGTVWRNSLIYLGELCMTTLANPSGSPLLSLIGRNPSQIGLSARQIRKLPLRVYSGPVVSSSKEGVDKSPEKEVTPLKPRSDDLPALPNGLKYIELPESQSACAICRTDYELPPQERKVWAPDTLRVLPCGHAFHSECLDEWLENLGTVDLFLINQPPPTLALAFVQTKSPRDIRLASTPFAMSGDSYTGYSNMYGYGQGQGNGQQQPQPGAGYPTTFASYPTINGVPTTTISSGTSIASNEGSTSAPPKKAPKKRKSTATNGSGEDGEGDGGEEHEGRKKKRIKTPRACDICRRSKRRAHSLQCTWFLPISETRFSKKRGTKDDAEPAANLPGPSSTSFPLPSAPVRSPSLNISRPIDSPPIYNQQQYPHALGSPAYHLDPNYSHSNASSPDTNGAHPHRKEPRLVGPTSISHLMHSTSTFPVDRMGPVDSKYAQSLTVDDTGDGFIRVISAGDGEPGEQGGAVVAIQGIERGDAEKLLNYFFATHACHFPIVTKADFLSSLSPTPLLFNAICGISALSHHVSPTILRTIKSTIRATLREEDIVDNSSVKNIQALLIYAYSMELEKGTAASKTWNILGLAIRMAQDLGLHRKLGTEIKQQSEADHTELRRRVWGGCLIADRWISAIYGQPMMIDLADCDCLLPSVFDIRPNAEFDAERRPYLFNSALISLSILLGRILKMVYSPTGIMTLSAAEAEKLFDDLDKWQAELPSELQFEGAETSSSAQGFLHLLYIPVRFLLTRPFMRLSFQLPERFANISVGHEQWGRVERAAREAIEWVDKNESCLEGWFVGTYSFFVCSLIQYHGHIRRRDTKTLGALRLARDTLKASQRLVVPDGECHVRAKLAEILHLLYHTACSVAQWAPETVEGSSPATPGSSTSASITALNPTLGVRQREQDWHPKNNVRLAPATYSTSLRSTHIPDLPDPPTPIVTSPQRTSPAIPGPNDSLNFNPSIGMGGDGFFDAFGEQFGANANGNGNGMGNGNGVGNGAGAADATQMPLFSNDGLFDGGFLDWGAFLSLS
ncbi:hypothetical protein P7C70_g5556, partial [Phenoliferia sp. Uapishka_3]